MNKQETEVLAILTILVECMPVSGGMVRFDGELLERARKVIAAYKK